MMSQDLFTQSPFKENTTLCILKNIEEKKKLIEDIQNLKKLRAKINQSLGHYTTVRPFPEKSFVNSEETFVRNLQKVPDAIGILKEELYKYSGIYCTKYEQDKEYIFEFNSCKSSSKNETYFVQILLVENEGKLGFWKMPVLLDVHEILSKCPIEDMRQVKNFLRLCKYYLDCQKSRKTQFEDIKTYVEELRMCSVQANLEAYTNVQIQIFMLREIETDKFYDIVLYIVYELNESRPNKLVIDSLHKETLPEDVTRKLKKFFKNFKLLELKPAFEEIADQGNAELFRWEKSFKEENIVVENDEVDSDGFSQEEGNDLSEMRSLTEEKGYKEGGQQSKEDNEVKNQRLKESVVGVKKTSGKQKVRSLQNEKNNSELEEEKEKSNKREKSILKKNILKKVHTNKKLENTQSGVGKQIRFEEHNEEDKENELVEMNEEETNKKRKIKKVPRRVKAKVFKTPKRTRKQTKLDFSRQNINIEEIHELKEKEDEEKIHKETNQTRDDTQSPKNNRTSPERSQSQNKIENKENEVTEIGEKSHEIENVEGNSKQQNENPRIEVLESEAQNESQTNVQEITTEDPRMRSPKIAKTKNDKNRRQILLEGKGAEKKTKSKKIGNKSVKKTFHLSNFILKRKKPTSSNNNEDLLKTISGEDFAKSSTPIPDRKQTHLQIETDISEIINVNKPIRKSPEKRPRSDSSDSGLEDIREEPDQSLLKNLEEIQEKVLKSSAANDNKKVKKPAKRVKGRSRKARKL